MPRARRRKCPHCGQWYDPDPRNRWHQRYCAAPACRRASKAASQQRWRASPRGRNYFRGSANPIRVQTWRKAHPGYWRRHRRKRRALQDYCAAQVLVPPQDKPTLTPRALQDLVVAQGLTLTGLMAQLTGSALQDHITSTTRRLIRSGLQIWASGPIRHPAVPPRYAAVAAQDGGPRRDQACPFVRRPRVGSLSPPEEMELLRRRGPPAL